MSEPVIHPYHEWHAERVASCLAQLRKHLPNRRPLTCLDLGHDPEMGQALTALGLTVTGNIHPLQPRPDVPWTLVPFDFEGDFPLPDGQFDLVTAFEVIEHVVGTPRHLLREARRVLAPGGLLYLGTPNVTSWAKVRRMISQVHPYDANTYGLDFGPRHAMCHVYEYDPWTLKKVVSDEGFTVVECKTWDTYDNDPRGVRNVALRALVTASLAVTGHVRDAAQLWRLRGHQIGLVSRAG